MTLDDVEPVFPAASVAVQVMVVVPKWKVEPEAGEQVVGREPLTMSTAVAENVATAPEGPVASRVTGSPDIDTNGGVVSRTVTVEEAEPTLPAASVAVHLTAVVPSGKVELEDGEQVGVSVPPTMSVADAEKVATAPLGPVASRVVGSPDIVTTGGVVSTTVTMKLALALLLEESVAVQLTCVEPTGNVDPD
jgi:non-canonical (house-cleaning) NTP pyrophosphatase